MPDRSESARPHGEEDPVVSEAPRRRKHRRAVRPGTGPEPLVDRRQYESDGTDTGGSDDDDRFLRDVPPHWS
ncbi:hypothetical protein [Ruania alba]|uniref:hypothetical protein n=1 Tax=Ruania alba TaxID=648782 RepID=UPI000B7D22F2|nr:hypothetical protein [Ruania alba]